MQSSLAAVVAALDLRLACVTALNEAGSELVCLMRCGSDAPGYFQPGFVVPVLPQGAGGGLASGPSPSQPKGALSGKGLGPSLLSTGEFGNSKLDSITENRSDERFRLGEGASSLMRAMCTQVRFV